MSSEQEPKTLQRRQFITSLAALSATSLLPRGARAACFARRPKVIVVGAGIAGLATADLLRRSNCEVIVLEASGRVGGKILGGTVGPFSFDIGGQGFSHDMTRVRAMGRRYHLTEIPCPAQIDFFARRSEVLTGDRLDHDYRGLENLMERATTLYRSLGQPAMRAQYNSMSVAAWAARYLPRESVDIFASNFSAEWCDAPERVSLLHFLEASHAYVGTDKEMEFRFREGLFSITDGLSRDLGTAIHLHSPVQSLNFTASNVTVRTPTESLTADAVVLAIPMPQLRRLPISGLNLGTLPSVLPTFEGGAVRKILAVYNRPFWKGHPCQGEFAEPNGFCVMDNSDEGARIYSLLFFLGGPLATRPFSQKDILSRAATVFGPQVLTPIAYRDQAWLNSEFLPGGYASNRIVSRTGSERLPTSIDRLFLAGSETADILPTYIEGALSSAERAADAVLRRLQC